MRRPLVSFSTGLSNQKNGQEERTEHGSWGLRGAQAEREGLFKLCCQH